MIGSYLQPGIYKHFKGNLYEVVGVARQVDTAQCFVIYRPIYGERQLVARPFEDFTGTVNRNGGPEPRFRLVESGDDACQCRSANQACGSA